MAIIYLARSQIFRKTNIPVRIREVKNASFSENFANVSTYFQCKYNVLITSDSTSSAPDLYRRKVLLTNRITATTM